MEASGGTAAGNHGASGPSGRATCAPTASSSQDALKNNPASSVPTKAARLEVRTVSEGSCIDSRNDSKKGEGCIPTNSLFMSLGNDPQPLSKNEKNNLLQDLKGENKKSGPATAKKPEVVELLDDSDDDDDRKRPATKKLKSSEEDKTEDMIFHCVMDNYMEQFEEDLRKQKEEDGMLNSIAGRAFFLVEDMIQAHQKILQDSSTLLDASTRDAINLVGHDDMVFLAEKFIECQQSFVAQNKPGHVSLAYHYTRKEQLQSIRQDGLLSHPERQAQNVASVRHGAVYGDGVYTGNNPFVFTRFGDTGLLVAILKGNEYTATAYGGSSDPDINTILGNKMRNQAVADSTMYDEIVLRKSCQVLPIIQFPRSLVSVTGSLQHNGNALLWRFHEEVQKLLDNFFNDNVPTPLVRVAPSPTNPVHQSLLLPLPANVPGISLAAARGNSVNGASLANMSPREAEMRRQKEHFLMFTRVLMKYLEAKDPSMHKQVKQIIKDCAERNKRKEKGYESVISSMRERLKPMVGDTYWKRAESYLAHFLALKEKTKVAAAAGCSSSSSSGTLGISGSFSAGGGASTITEAQRKAELQKQELPRQKMIQQQKLAAHQKYQQHQQQHQQHAAAVAQAPILILKAAQQPLFQSQAPRHPLLRQSQAAHQTWLQAHASRQPLLQAQAAQQTFLSSQQSWLQAQTVHKILQKAPNPNHRGGLPQAKLPSPAKAFTATAVLPRGGLRGAFSSASHQGGSARPKAAEALKEKSNGAGSFRGKAASRTEQFCAPVGNETLAYTAMPLSQVLSRNGLVRERTVENSDVCSSCSTGLLRRGKIFRVCSCGHLFHAECLAKSLSLKGSCPTCGVPIPGDVPSQCPSGVLQISSSQSQCAGHESSSNGSILLRFNLLDGAKVAFDFLTGQSIHLETFNAWLPNNPEGRKALDCIKAAWTSGLLFKPVNDPGCADANVVQSTVQLKNSICSGGVFGFPDPNYFTQLNSALDTLKVPP